MATLSRSLGVFLDHPEADQPGDILDPIPMIAEGCDPVHAVFVGEDVRLKLLGIN